jgi:hypothetical protein
MSGSDQSADVSPYAGLAARIRPGGSVEAQAIAAERAKRPPRLRIALTRGTFGLLQALIEPCRVLVDGVPVGVLTSEKTFETDLAPGSHSLQIACGLLWSNPVRIEVVNGDVAQFICSSRNSALDFFLGMTLFCMLVVPFRFYTLREFCP